MQTPTRDDILQMMLREIYPPRVINNAHRGDLVEMMVLKALGPSWKLVGIGWHPWDLQRGYGEERIRVQVKQCALLQLWGRTKVPTFEFGWSAKPPDYFERDNPGETIETEGWFCDVFVFGYHDGDNPQTTDQTDPSQWQFSVVPVCDLDHGRDSMVAHKALKLWPPVGWPDLRDAVEKALMRNQQQGASQWTLGL